MNSLCIQEYLLLIDFVELITVRKGIEMKEKYSNPLYMILKAQVSLPLLALFIPYTVCFD